jgi:hypothetical protein
MLSDEGGVGTVSSRANRARSSGVPLVSEPFPAAGGGPSGLVVRRGAALRAPVLPALRVPALVLRVAAPRAPAAEAAGLAGVRFAAFRGPERLPADGRPEAAAFVARSGFRPLADRPLDSPGRVAARFDGRRTFRFAMDDVLSEP